MENSLLVRQTASQGPIFEAQQHIRKYAPSPVWAMCTAEKRGGLICGRIRYYNQFRLGRMNVKVKLVSNFVVDIESSSFDAQEAQKGPGYKARSNPSYSLVQCCMLKSGRAWYTSACKVEQR